MDFVEEDFRVPPYLYKWWHAFAMKETDYIPPPSEHVAYHISKQQYVNSYKRARYMRSPYFYKEDNREAWERGFNAIYWPVVLRTLHLLKYEIPQAKPKYLKLRH